MTTKIPKYTPDPLILLREKRSLAQTTEWTYHAELDGAKFRTRFERNSEQGEHQFVVEECDKRTGEWNKVWVSSWIGKREPSP
jgi:hypothetical protein